MMNLNKIKKFLIKIAAASAVVYVGCAIIVGSMCVNLNVQKQKINKQINSLTIKNEALSVEVDAMEDYNNVATIIQEEGLGSTTIINLGH